MEIGFNLANSEGVNMNPESFRAYSRRDGDAGFKFLACRADLPRRNQIEAGVRRRRARDTSLAAPKSDEGGPTYLNNRLPALHSLGVGGCEYKAVFVVGDVGLPRRSRTKAEVSQFSDEITVNCAPLV